MKFRNIVIYLLCILMFVGCSSAAPQESDTTAESTTIPVTEAVTEPVEVAPLDRIPVENFNGYEYKILATTNNFSRVSVAEMNGELVNDAVYKANQTVMDRYNIAIKHLKLSKVSASSEITKNIDAGDDMMDLVIANDYMVGNLSLKGYCHNILDIEQIDVSQPWWPQYTTEALTLNGKMFLISNYMGYNGLRGTKCMYFNKQLAENYNLENPYDLVRSREWTLDKLIEMSNNIYDDKNGNGIAETTDMYGFAFTGLFYGWLENFGIEAYQKVDNGTDLTLNINTDRTTSLFEKLHNWLYGGNSGIYFAPKHSGLGKPDSYPYMFANESTIFTYGSIYVLLDALKESNVDYGFLPMPLFDASQKDYYGVSYEEPSFIPISVQDTAKTGLITEALSAAGYTYIYPAYKEIALQTKYAQDEDSSEMLDIIFSNRYYSFSYVYGESNTKGFQNILNSVLKDSSGNLVSYYEANKEAQQVRIEQIVNAFTETPIPTPAAETTAP